MWVKGGNDITSFAADVTAGGWNGVNFIGHAEPTAPFIRFTGYFLEPRDRGVLALLSGTDKGLSRSMAMDRLKTHGFNTLKGKSRSSAVLLFLGQFKSPVTLLLIGADQRQFRDDVQYGRGVFVPVLPAFAAETDFID